MEPGGPREDERLAYHVLAREVVARVGLGVASGDGVGDGARERHAALDLGEEERERAREHGADGAYAVAGRDEVAERANNRQSGADRRLVAERGALAVAQIAQAVETGLWPRARTLARRDDADACFEQVLVDRAHLQRAGRVDHRQRPAVGDERVYQAREVGRRGVGQKYAERLWRHARFSEHVAARRRGADNAEGRAREARDLLAQGAADVAEAEDEHVQRGRQRRARDGRGGVKVGGGGHGRNPVSWRKGRMRASSASKSMRKASCPKAESSSA